MIFWKNIVPRKRKTLFCRVTGHKLELARGSRQPKMKPGRADLNSIWYGMTRLLSSKVMVLRGRERISKKNAFAQTTPHFLNSGFRRNLKKQKHSVYTSAASLKCRLACTRAMLHEKVLFRVSENLFFVVWPDTDWSSNAELEIYENLYEIHGRSINGNLRDLWKSIEIRKNTRKFVKTMKIYGVHEVL